MVCIESASAERKREEPSVESLSVKCKGHRKAFEVNSLGRSRHTVGQVG